MKIDTLGIVGVGLLGGSVALAAAQRGLARRILGFDHSSAALARAVARGMLEPAGSLASVIQQSDVIVLCGPVDVILQGVPGKSCKPGALVTDVGSTKARIVAEAQRVFSPGVFVGSHPLAGSEKSGADHSHADLFAGKVVVITPHSSRDPVDRARAFWQALGARVEVMAPDEHDLAMAQVSHLPHVAASALAALLPRQWTHLTAGGFRDTTRIASGSPELWRAILTDNRVSLIEAIGELQDRLAEFKLALLSNDAEQLRKLLTEGKEVRDSLPSA